MNIVPNRRNIIAASIGLAAAPVPAQLPTPGPDIARDTAYWAAYGQLFDRPTGTIQLEHGYFGAVARPVRDAYRATLDRVNRDTALYARRGYAADIARVRAAAAATLGVAPDEIAFTRNASESMQLLIGGYHALKPGDSVLIADLDYPAMQDAMRWLEERRGVRVVQITIPEPATHDSILAAYARAFADTPRLKLALVTHVGHRTGLMMPVAAIVAQARAAQIDVLVDSAQAWGQTEFTLPDLGADFVGLNGHKWIGAPLGIGLIYIKRARLDAIAPFMGSPSNPVMPIESRLHTGTINFATWLALEPALELHNRIGVAAKAARHRHLRSLWVTPLVEHPRLEILTPEDPRLHTGATAFRIKGMTTMAQNAALSKRLLDEFRIMTVAREGAAKGACVRITPAPFTPEADLAALVQALQAIA